MCQELSWELGYNSGRVKVSTLTKTLALLNNIYQKHSNCQLLAYVLPLHVFFHLFLTATM